MDNLIKKLVDRVNGQVLVDEGDLQKFSRDQSNYYIRPKAVVIPADIEDILKTVALAADAGVAITPRGGGSGTAGAGLGHGIMIAFDRKGPLNRIVNFDASTEVPEITVEAGVVHRRVQDYLREHGLFLPADPSSDNISLLGGNIATKASGPHALKHGSIDRYLKHLCFISSRGEFIDTTDETTIPPRIKAGILRLKQNILADKAAIKRLSSRAHRKIASGYNLFAFLREIPLGELVAQLLVGSVGTLGIITSATLKTEPYIKGRATLTIPFKDLHEAGDAVPYICELGAAAVEIISADTIRMVRQRRKKAFEKLAANSHLLLVEFEGEERFEQLEAVKKIIDSRGYRLDSSPYAAVDEVSQAELWKQRKQVPPAILGFQPPLQALSVVNDVGVEVTCLADFVLDVQRIFKNHGLTGAIYGHFGSGNLHLRPLFDTRRPNIETLINSVADEVFAAVFKYDGTITAEHGMGRLRAPYLRSEWGDSIVGYMTQLKEIFDPDDVLNPGVVFSSHPITMDMMIKKE